MSLGEQPKALADTNVLAEEYWGGVFGLLLA